MKSVLVAMSSGADSTCSALILLEKGYKVCGITFILTDDDFIVADKAGKLAEKMGIEHYTRDLRGEFDKYVITPFVESYINGETPNPCAMCNKNIKFKYLYEEMRKRSFDYMATGHYARVDNKEYNLIKKSMNQRRDQSFFLSTLDDKMRSSLILPLGDFSSKDEIFDYCKSKGYNYSPSSESRGICFVDGIYSDYISKHSDVDLSAEVHHIDEGYLSTTDNYTAYTVGQKKDIPHSYSVLNIDVDNAKIIVGSEEKLYKKCISLREAHFHVQIDTVKIYSVKMFNWGYLLKARIDKANAKVNFLEPVRAPARGQQAVIYDDDCVIGYGIII